MGARGGGGGFEIHEKYKLIIRIEHFTTFAANLGI